MRGRGSKGPEMALGGRENKRESYRRDSEADRAEDMLLSGSKAKATLSHPDVRGADIAFLWEIRADWRREDWRQNDKRTGAFWAGTSAAMTSGGSGRGTVLRHESSCQCFANAWRAGRKVTPMLGGRMPTLGAGRWCCRVKDTVVDELPGPTDVRSRFLGGPGVSTFCLRLCG